MAEIDHEAFLIEKCRKFMWSEYAEEMNVQFCHLFQCDPAAGNTWVWGQFLQEAYLQIPRHCSHSELISAACGGVAAAATWRPCWSFATVLQTLRKMGQTPGDEAPQREP